MASNGIQGSNPFSDHAAITEEEREFVTESTIAVGRNATLTLGTDALIVVDEGLRDTPRFNCFGLIPTKSTSTRSIPFYSILWVEVSKVDLTVHYAKPTSKSTNSSVRVAYINYSIDNSGSTYERLSKWASRLLNRAYGRAQRKKRIKVLINPFGGAGKAEKLYTKDIAPIFAAAKCEVDVEKTKYSGHAVDIAEKIDINAYDVLASASGDGLPHECINGLAKQPNAAEALRKIAIVQLPCGTGNAMSWNFNGTDDCSLAALAIVKGLRAPLDLVSVTQRDKRTISFLSQSLGIIAESDLGTDNIRWMGDARFTYGFLVRLLGKTVYPCDLAVKEEIVDKREIKAHYANQVTKLKRPSAITQSDLDGPLDTTKGLGLPPLKYGTINDELPTGDGWTPLISYPNLGNLYSGNMTIMAKDAPFFPASLPSDGLLDLVTIDGTIGRMKALNLFLSVPKETFFDSEFVRVRKVSALRVIPKYGRWSQKDQNKKRTSRLGGFLNQFGVSGGHKNASEDGGFFSVDGERLPFEPFQIEIHKSLGTVLSKKEGTYQFHGPTGWEAFSSISEEGTSGSG